VYRLSRQKFLTGLEAIREDSEVPQKSRHAAAEEQGPDLQQKVDAWCRSIGICRKDRKAARIRSSLVFRMLREGADM
jgi:hypothetical protein